MAEIPQAIQNQNGEEGMDVDTEEVKLKISFFSHFSTTRVTYILP